MSASLVLLGSCQRTIHTFQPSKKSNTSPNAPYTAIQQELGRMLRKQRMDEAGSQTEIAARLGVGMDTLQSWEENRTFPPSRYHQRIATFLGFDPFMAEA